MFGAILNATNSSFQKGMTFCLSIYMCYAFLHILLCMYLVDIISCECIIARFVINLTAISTYSMLIVSVYLIGRQPDINTKLKMRRLSTFMLGPAIVLYI